MLKIYKNKTEVPEEDKEFFEKHYKQRSDGSWEPDIEGVNSIGAVLAKNTELTEEITKTLRPRLRELEGKEVLTDGKVAVDKKEFEALQTENESYRALGELSEIKPKVEGYDELKTQTKQALKDEALRAAGVQEIERARKFKVYDELEIEKEIKDGKEIFYRVTVDDKQKVSKTPFDSEVLKSDGFKDDLGSLLGSSGTKMFRQGTNNGNHTPTIETEKEAVKASGIYGL